MHVTYIEHANIQRKKSKIKYELSQCHARVLLLSTNIRMIRPLAARMLGQVSPMQLLGYLY